jgi:hypothetical protein
MKTNRIQFYFLTLLLMTLFSSCSIQKRTFNQGYYFNWHFSSKTKLAEKQTSENESVVKESLASEKEFIKESSDLNEKNFAENDLKNETDRRLDDQESVVATTERKHSSFSQIMDLPRSVIKSEIKSELRKLRDTQFMAPPARKMSVVLKLAIIFSGLAIISLIIAFWSWYFYILGGLVGTATVPTFRIFLIAGLISLALGLFLFILHWLTN